MHHSNYRITSYFIFIDDNRRRRPVAVRSEIRTHVREAVLVEREGDEEGDPYEGQGHHDAEEGDRQVPALLGVIDCDRQLKKSITALHS